MRRHLRAAAIAALIAIGATGCGGGGVDGPVLTSGYGNGGEDAEVKGTIVLDGDCLLLELEAIRYPVVWPRGTRWQEDPPAVVLSSDVVPIGGSVHGGGGYYQADHLDSLPDEVVDAAVACAGPTGEIAVFNWGSEVSITTT